MQETMQRTTRSVAQGGRTRTRCGGWLRAECWHAWLAGGAAFSSTASELDGDSSGNVTRSGGRAGQQASRHTRAGLLTCTMLVGHSCLALLGCDGARNGMTEVHDKNGRLIGQGVVVDGVREGLWTSYFDETGSLFSQGVYLKGRQTGLWIGWHSNGNVRFRGEYAEGKKNGLWEEWYDNGGRMSVEHYRNDTLDGDACYWRDSGSVVKRGQFQNGVGVGTWMFVSETGYESRVDVSRQ